MTITRLNSADDIRSRVARKYKELTIKDISTDKDTSGCYVQGLIIKKSDLQKTKRFNYMKLTLEDVTGTKTTINVFVTGDIAEDICKLPDDTVLILTGFLVENNTRASEGSHKYQLVLDTDTASPKAYYLPAHKLKEAQPIDKVKGRQLRSTIRVAESTTSSKKTEERQTNATREKLQLAFVKPKNTIANTGDVSKSTSSKEKYWFRHTGTLKQSENVSSKDLDSTTLAKSSPRKQNSHTTEQQSGASPISQKQQASTSKQSPVRQISLKQPSTSQSSGKETANKQSATSTNQMSDKQSPSKQSGVRQVAAPLTPTKQVATTQKGTTQSAQKQAPTKQSTSNETQSRQSPTKRPLDFQPVAGPSTAGQPLPSRSQITNTQAGPITTAQPQTQSPLKNWTVKKNVTTQKYVYQNLDTLKSNTSVNIYGVVKFCKPPYRTRGSDHCMIVSMVDPTLYGDDGDDKKLKCLLFNREIAKLPRVNVGYIIRFHRLKISMYNGELQGQSGPGLAWCVFSGKQGDPLEPLSSQGPNYTFTNDDKNKIEELRDWLNSKEELRDGDHGCCIEDLVPDIYFDLSCQVISTCVLEENVCLLFRIWDGTKSIYPIRDFDTETQNCAMNSDQTLLRRSKDFIYDVALYDDHVNRYRHIQPRQFLKLCNLHAAKYVNVETREDLAALPTVELVVHRGTSFGRGVVELTDDWPEVKVLKERLEKVAPSDDPFEDDIDIVTSSSERTNCLESSRKRNQPHSSDLDSSIEQPSSAKKRLCVTQSSGNSNEQTSKKSRSSDLNMSCDQPELDITCDQLTQTNTQDSGARCMLQTATVVLNHPFTQRTKIQDVLTHEVPYKFRILAHVEDYFPKADTPENFIKLYCPSCHYLQNVQGASSESTEKKLTVTSTRNGIRYYNCPKCEENQENSSDIRVDSTTPKLEYIYMMRFLLNDGSGWLIANVWKQEAVTFFKDIEPIDATKSKKMFQKVRDCLDQICPGGDEEKPWIECCVKSYSNQEGVGFQIFDTEVA